MTTEEPENFSKQLELALEENSNVKIFAAKKKPAHVEDYSQEDFIQRSIETFTEEIAKDSKGFLAIMFDVDNSPRIICAGDIDIIATLGALEVTKHELFKGLESEIS